jgi:hypothetical protein
MVFLFFYRQHLMSAGGSPDEVPKYRHSFARWLHFSVDQQELVCGQVDAAASRIWIWRWNDQSLRFYEASVPAT